MARHFVSTLDSNFPPSAATAISTVRREHRQQAHKRWNGSLLLGCCCNRAPLACRLRHKSCQLSPQAARTNRQQIDRGNPVPFGNRDLQGGGRSLARLCSANLLILVAISCVGREASSDSDFRARGHGQAFPPHAGRPRLWTTRKASRSDSRPWTGSWQCVPNSRGPSVWFKLECRATRISRTTAGSTKTWKP